MSVTLHQGDCVDVMLILEADSIDMACTSPPYDALRDYKGYVFDFQKIALQLYRVIKPGGVLVWVVGDSVINGSESGNSFRQALYFMDIGFNLHDTMIYKKCGIPYPSSTRYYQQFEYMFILSKGPPTAYNPIMDRRNRWSGGSWSNQSNRMKNGELVQRNKHPKIVSELGVRTNIWEFHAGSAYGQVDKSAYEHPATFPEKLARDHIISWSNPGDTILDPMMGSGTTGIQAIRYQRSFIGIEISQEYFALAEKRINKEQLQIHLEM